MGNKEGVFWGKGECLPVDGHENLEGEVCQVTLEQALHDFGCSRMPVEGEEEDSKGAHVSTWA